MEMETRPKIGKKLMKEKLFFTKKFISRNLK